MNGCLHGRWVLGVAHGNSAMPATVVPVRNFVPCVAGAMISGSVIE